MLVTGSAGLIGREVCAQLSAIGVTARRFDVADATPAGFGDVTNPRNLDAAMRGCEGVIHLAAVARLVAAEEDPLHARLTNVAGTREVLAAALRGPRRPWLVFASSREVYGDAPTPPVSEDAPYAPCNVYAATKVASEQAVLDAASRGARAAVVRLSNVYGGLHDHEDRVVPAFVLNALSGHALRVDGADAAFDFTHVSDAAHGLIAAGAALRDGRTLPPLHLATGVSTPLLDLARDIVSRCGSRSPIVVSSPRGLGASSFRGDPARAAAVLGWRAKVGLEDGLERLVALHRSSRPSISAAASG